MLTEPVAASCIHSKTPKSSAQVLIIQGLPQGSLLHSSCLTSSLTWCLCQRCPGHCCCPWNKGEWLQNILSMQNRSPKAVGTPEMRFQEHLMVFVSMSKALYQPLPPSQHCWLLLQGKLRALVSRNSSTEEEGAIGNGGQRVAENLPFQPCLQEGWERQQLARGTLPGASLSQPQHPSSGTAGLKDSLKVPSSA